jgi:hypothetical protein
LSTQPIEEQDAGLILAAEECPPDKFDQYHFFSRHDDMIIRKLTAHGPVLIRGGRGSGKSALLIEAYRRIRQTGNIFSVYMSLRYLKLLQADGQEYIHHFCTLLSTQISEELIEQGSGVQFELAEEETALQLSLAELSQRLNKRIVILFDDAAHIGREKPLEVFFDLFRTLSTSTTSCKASIYPGVTRFGTRFDVFNDSTVLDIVRSETAPGSTYFLDVLKTRYPELAARSRFSDRLHPEQFANLIGRAVVGNMRGFILACNRFDGEQSISIPEVNACLLNMATDYYWPLMEEVAPKLGVYEPLIEPSTEVFQAIMDYISRILRQGTRSMAPDRVTVHKQIVQRFSKAFEILEYLGFFARREASRGMKSGGRGAVFAINLCSLLEQIPTKRLTIEMIEEWLEGRQEPAEIHSTGTTFSAIQMPELHQEQGLGILQKPVAVLAKSRAYPYGLTADKITRLQKAGIKTVGQLASSTDQKLLAIDYVGEATVKRMRDVTHQAIWM